MIKQIKWVEMKFDFEFPSGKFPPLLERLSGTPARLEEKLVGLPKSVLTQKTINSHWSLQEHAGHLLDLEELIKLRLADFENGAETLTPADMRNKKTYNAGHNEKDISQILSAFRSSRLSIIEKLRRLDERMVLRTSLHPRLKKPMRLIDLVLFFSEHDDHHLAIMSTILNETA